MPSTLGAYSLSERLNINGFGTVGVSTNDRDDILYHAQAESSFVGKDEYNFRTNTVAGLQGTLNVFDSFSITAQGLIRDHQQDHWKSELQWAYMQYESPLDVTVRLGQFRLPIFQTTELAYVGYSRTWANPALPFYGVSGFEFMQGAQLLYTTSLDSYDLTLRANYGQSEDELPKPPDPNIRSIELESNDIFIVSAQLSHQNFWINIAYTQLSGTSKTYKRDNSVVNEHKLHNKTYSVEYHFDYQGINLDGGFALADNDGLPDERLIYQSVAYRIDTFKPYILYSQKQFKDNALPPPPGPVLPPPSQFSASKVRDTRMAVGCRYDVYTGIALKYQFERIDNAHRPSRIANKSAQSNVNHVHTVVLDWMF